MYVQTGDWILIDYTGKRASDNKVIETTSEEVAKKDGLYDEKVRYIPSLVILGKETTLKGLEDALLKMKVGESKQVTVTPEMGFGTRDSSLVRVMSVGEFRRRNVDPQPGMMVDLDGRQARVKSVTSGRVTVDMNHPLAGETIAYDVKVLELLKTPEKQAQALLDTSMRIATKAEPAKFSFKEGVLEVQFDEGLAKDMNFVVGKTEFVANALRFMPDIKKIRTIEDYVRKK